MGATGYMAIFVVLCTYIGANAYCHLIGRDDENIRSSCIDQSDDTTHLLRYMHTKATKMPMYPVAPTTRIQSDFIEKTK